MGLQNFSILEAVEVSLGIEREGEKFYALAAAGTEDVEMKKLFEMLREKELEHMNVFRGLFSDMTERQGDSNAALYLLDPQVASVFQAYAETAVFPVKGGAEKVIEECGGTEDILRLGMQAEKDSILYYHELLEHSPYPEAKELVKKIIAEEGQHLAFLHGKLKEIQSPA